MSKKKTFFKSLSDTDKAYIEQVYWNKSIPYTKRLQILCEKYNKDERTIRRICSNDLKIKRKIDTNIIIDCIEAAKKKSFDKSKKYFLISCAQNSTDVNIPFLRNMESYAEYINGEILIIPIRYHNPTSLPQNSGVKQQDHWSNSIASYLTLKRLKLNNNVVVFGDVKIQFTNSNPLNGFESLSNNGTGILAHSRVHMKSLPVIDTSNPKLLFSTGICTIPNYTDTRIGKISEFHHCYGFVLVEIVDDTTYYIRQVVAKQDGSFNDLYYNVSNQIVKRNKACNVLVKGDIHYGNHDENVMNQSLNVLATKLKPNQMILHDVFDGYSINHHEKDNWIKQYKNKDYSLKKEIDNLITWLQSIKHLNPVIVFSNHDDFLNRYIINNDVRNNIKNAMEYLEYAKVLLNDEAPNGLIAHIVNKIIPTIKCLGRNDSYLVDGWQLAVHGMDGANGSRGSITQFKKLNTRIITGHTHSVSRIDGALVVGTNSKLDMGYNVGLSNWVQSDVIIHNDSKAQHIFYIGKQKEFTTFE
ncbi:hypothetical protein MEO93_20915 [Dolichospermum sp. ST_sed3]|nr:hypothetical protein [Dolichospermum sp. ST_sed3]